MKHTNRFLCLVGIIIIAICLIPFCSHSQNQIKKAWTTRISERQDTSFTHGILKYETSKSNVVEEYVKVYVISHFDKNGVFIKNTYEYYRFTGNNGRIYFKKIIKFVERKIKKI